VNLRTRLTVLVAVSVGLAVVFVAVVATLTTRNELRESVDAALEQRARAAVDPRRGGPPGRPGPDPLGAGDTTSRIFDERGEVVAGVGLTPQAPLTDRDLAVAAGREGGYFRDGEIDGDRLRILTVPTQDGQAVQLARSVSGLDATISRLTLTYALLGAVASCAPRSPACAPTSRCSTASTSWPPPNAPNCWPTSATRWAS
jgi:hypothetical protein